MKKLQQIQIDLEKRLSGGGDSVMTDVYNRVGFSTDASIYQIMPLCVVRPRSSADVAATVKYAYENDIPVSARGAASGLAGESLTDGIVLDTMRYMNNIVGVNDDASEVTVQPGVILDNLNVYLSRYGKKIGPDPSSGNRAVIGGIVANNATGGHWLQYGYISNWIESMEVVLSDGRIVRLPNRFDPAGHDEYNRYELTELARKVVNLLEENEDLIRSSQPKTKRNRCGYNISDVCSQGRIDLAKMMAGSECTLGIFTEITLKTVDLPKAKALVQFEFDTFSNLAKAVPFIVDSGAVSCEMMDRNLMDLARQAYPQYGDIFPAKGAAALIVEHVGDDQGQVIEKISKTVGMVGRLAAKYDTIIDPLAQQRVWKSRKDAVPLLNREKGDKQPLAFVEDVSVENSLLDKYVEGMGKIGQKYDIPMAYYGHAGDGELHIRPYLDLSKEQDIQVMREIAAEVFALAWSLGGTISGEHADGLVRVGYIEQQYGPEYYRVLRRIKKIFDPKCILNPGKIINDDPDVMIKNLRASHLPLAERMKTELLFDPDEFRFEMKQCNGCGVCLSCSSPSRMCPTFRSLCEELATSRGKANLIRAWLTGQMTEEQFYSPEFKKKLGFCVNCKMCSVECPAGVDISKLVIEARSRLAKKMGLTRTEKALAHNRYLSVMASTFAPVSNFFMNHGVFKWFVEILTGLDRTRSMPVFSRGSFIRKGRKYLKSHGRLDDPVEKVAYFVDSYANYNDHELGYSVVKLLLHNNIEVIIPDQKPVPLPAYVYGDIKTARSELQYSVKHLARAVRNGYKIVCSEPSAALCLKDELLSVIDSEDARLVSENTYELMDWLNELNAQGSLKPVNKPSAHKKYPYHAPCHQCAMGYRNSSIRLLKDLADIDIIDIEGGCCGLAGTCGMQKKNHDMAKEIARDMVEKLNRFREKTAVTECAACKMQIENMTDKQVIHPVKIIAGLYDLN